MRKVIKSGALPALILTFRRNPDSVPWGRPSPVAIGGEAGLVAPKRLSFPKKTKWGPDEFSPHQMTKRAGSDSPGILFSVAMPVH